MRRSYLCIINCTVLKVVRPLCQAARFTTRVQKLYTSLAPRGKRTITHNSLVTPSYCCSSILQRNSKAKKTLMNATSRIYSSCSPTAEGNELSSNQVSGSPIRLPINKSVGSSLKLQTASHVICLLLPVIFLATLSVQVNLTPMRYLSHY